MGAPVPLIEVSHHTYSHCVWRPNGEVNSANSCNFFGMCAQLVIFLVMRALAHQVQIKVCQKGREIIGIVNFSCGAGIMDAKFVTAGNRARCCCAANDCFKSTSRMKASGGEFL